MFSASRVFAKAAVAASLILAASSVVAQPALTDINPEGCTYARAYDINASGQMAGFCQLYELGFGWYQSAAFWSSTGVETLLDPYHVFARYSEAKIISDSGLVAGFGEGKAFVWSSSTGIVEIPPLTNGGIPDSDRSPSAIADNGWVLGSSMYLSGGWNMSRTWLYRNGATEELTGPDGQRFGGYKMTPAGLVVGKEYNEFRWLLWDNGTWTYLTDPFEDFDWAFINSNRHIVLTGYSQERTSAARRHENSVAPSW